MFLFKLFIMFCFGILVIINFLWYSGVYVFRFGIGLFLCIRLVGFFYCCFEEIFVCYFFFWLSFLVFMVGGWVKNLWYGVCVVVLVVLLVVVCLWFCYYGNFKSFELFMFFVCWGLFLMVLGIVVYWVLVLGVDEVFFCFWVLVFGVFMVLFWVVVGLVVLGFVLLFWKFVMVLVKVGVGVLRIRIVFIFFLGFFIF